LWLLVPFVLVVVAVVATTRSVSPKEKATHATVAPWNGAMNESEGPQSFLDLAASTGGPVQPAQVAQAAAQADALPDASDSSRWQYLGPSNIAGRVVDVVVDPHTTPSTIYTGASSGGVWKSTDSGDTWTSAWPTRTNQMIGALAQGSDGTLYAGTGEGSNPSGGGSTFMGDGLYTSHDGGASWSQAKLPDSGAFARIVVNPENPKEVWAAAAGSLLWSSSQRGLWHSTDGGETWDLALAPTGPYVGAADISLQPGHPNVILASMWDHYRTNGSFFYGGEGSGLFRSTDDGKTWTRLTNANITGPLCSWDKSGTGLNQSADLGHIGVAFAPSDPNRAYIQFATSQGPDKGFYVSNDGGVTWKCGAQSGSSSGGYEWVFSRVWVDPVNEDHLFSANVSLKESTNGGQSWGTSSGPHSDNHAMAWDPNVPNRVYNGGDGGVWFSNQNGATRTWTKPSVQPWTQPYHLSVSQQNPDRQVIGLQDNGSVRTWTPGNNPTDLTQWNSYGGGDGFSVQIDPRDERTYYECLQPTPPRISCGKRVDAASTGATGSTTSNFSTPAWPSNTRVEVAMPMILDPADPDYVYVAGTSIARSAPGVVNSWTIISPPTPDDPASLPGVVPANEINFDTYYANEFGAVTSIAPAKSTGTATTPSSTIYAGTDTGLVWKTTNANAANGSDVQWTQLGKGVLPGTWVTSMTVDPSNANHVYASFSSYKEGDRAANIWETTDGGTTWKNISSDIPNAPVWHVTYDDQNGVLYAGENLGVFESTDDGAHWTDLSAGLPNAPILDMGLSADHSKLFVANYGRGVYELPLTDSASGSAGGTVPATLSLSLGAPASFGTFTPGVAKDYSASTTATVISTAGDASLSVADPGSNPGHLVNGSFSLSQPLQAQASSPAAGPGSALAAVSGSPLALLSWALPVSNDPVTIGLHQSIGANDALRTGSYSKTLTFTLSTTTP